MVCAGCGSRQCQTKSNIAEQNLQNFTIFWAALLILRTTANSVQNSARAESKNYDIHSLSSRPYQKFISWEGCFSHVLFRHFLFPSSFPFLSFPRLGSGPSNPAKGFGGALLAASVEENDICCRQTRVLALKTGNVFIVATNVALPTGDS